MKPTSMSPCSQVLAASLREIRNEAGLSLRGLARKLKTDPGMLSFWERSLRSPSLEQVARILGCLGVDNERFERLLHLARHTYDTNWLSGGVGPSSSDLSEGVIGLVECERAAKQVINWQPVVFQGLLQTADYAHAILMEEDISQEQADLRLVARLDRQKFLRREDPLMLTAIVAESVLFNQVGNEDIMSDQIDHLLVVTELPNVSFRIVPDDGKYQRWQTRSFVLFEFDDRPHVVHQEHPPAGSFLEDADEVVTHRGLACRLLDRALTEEDSRARLKELVR
ncbi:helix-turn-helix domain-containing protein [Amycolatopsis sp. NPDC059021]|uniref:helix-turn-helix domain-containing protein n=1 Tax=Amycolatopsis sp. NPDC059021 TaxID=3346704 RepID=UPI0036716CF5